MLLPGINLARNYKIFAVLCFAAIVMMSFHTKASAEEADAVPSYAEAHALWKSSGLPTADHVRLEIPAASFISKSADADIGVGELDGKSNVLLWNNPAGEVSYSFEAPKEGLYGISIEYYMISDIQEPVERGVRIGGKLPFAESANFLFERSFEKTDYPFQTDAEGNHIHPKMNEMKSWTAMALTDRNGGYEEPFEFLFKQGENRLTLTGLNGSIAVSKIVIHSPETIESYEAYRSGLPSLNEKRNYFNRLEAENSSSQSGTNIQIMNIAQPRVTPQVIGKRIFNSIGGDNWSNAHDWIEWEIDVPEDGLYQFAFKYIQNVNTDLNAYRSISIDGKAPFAEASSVAFPFGASWQIKAIGDSEPYDFYLTEGKHTIRLSVTNAPYREIRSELLSVVRKLRELDLEIKDITGVNNVDIYRRWDLKQYIPELDVKLGQYSETIRKQADALAELTGLPASNYGELITAANDLKRLSIQVDDIPKREDSLSLIYTSVTDWANKLDQQPLTLDQLMVKSGDAAFPNVKVSFFDKFVYFVKGFFASFSFDKSDIGKSDRDTIQVWVQRNKNYVSLMQDYANEYFTPDTGIKINVNYAPPGSNLFVLANAAGKQPDLAAGVDSFTTYSFAERGALVDLNQYPGYAEMRNNVVPGSLVPYHLDGGDYGFPEEVIYNVLYYREDILKSLNMDIPQTWDDVVTSIPTLAEHNYDFFYPYGDFQTFFAQNDVDAYTEDGLQVAFTSPQGFKAFQFWTDLYIKYGMPEQMANFYQHFRLGNAPVGITGIDQYMLFKLSAPDISGLWNIALAPGTKSGDGTIRRWEAGTQNGMMMFKTNPQRQEKAWRFMQWWLSTETQTDFANDLRNYFGPEFMWYSPNLQVVRQQSAWNHEVKEILTEQLRWYKPIPYVHGGAYMTPRALWNAWTATVIDKKNYRQQLEMAARDIQAEMNVKQLEFGVKAPQGRAE